MTMANKPNPVLAAFEAKKEKEFQGRSRPQIEADPQRRRMGAVQDAFPAAPGLLVKEYPPMIRAGILYNRLSGFFVYKGYNKFCVKCFGYLFKFRYLECVAFIFVIKILRGLPSFSRKLGLGHVATLYAAQADVFAYFHIQSPRDKYTLLFIFCQYKG